MIMKNFTTTKTVKSKAILTTWSLQCINNLKSSSQGLAFQLMIGATTFFQLKLFRQKKYFSRDDSKRPTLTLPESTTNLTPSMVMLVSAMLVDTMHFRTFSGGQSNTLSWSASERVLCSARTIHFCRNKDKIVNFQQKLESSFNYSSIITILLLIKCGSFHMPR